MLEQVKRLLGITDNSQDDILRFALVTVQDMILRYINWKELPAELVNALVLMTVSYYKSAGLGTSEISPGPVASVKRGDVSTSFATAAGASAASATFNLGEDNSDFFGWRTVLDEWRKLRW